MAHCINLFLAVMLQQLAKRGDACIWYFVTLVLDTTIGVVLCYLIHMQIEKFAIKNQIEVSHQ
jgi:hypothetical protein